MIETKIKISPKEIEAVIFDLDGVVTKTAKVHAAAWKKMFDSYLRRWQEEGVTGDHRAFSIEKDYPEYVDGKPRYEGVRSFLESRGIELDYGDPEDEPGKETICGLGNSKNEYFHEHLNKYGVEIYDDAVDLLDRLKDLGIKTAIVSSSKNCMEVVERAGLTGYFDAKSDGRDLKKLSLTGKPDPDIFLEATARLKTTVRKTAIIEDAESGVKAGRAGNFVMVIGVDRTGHSEELLRNGADVVTDDLSKIETPGGSNDITKPSALESMDEISRKLDTGRLAIFLDYDGTLTPIVDTPDAAVLSDDMRDTVKGLAQYSTLGVISGRDLQDVKKLVEIGDIFYAGSHGFDIEGPKNWKSEFQKGKEFLPDLDRAEQQLREKLEGIDKVIVERKKFSIAIHFRLVDKTKVPQIEETIDQIHSEFPKLRKASGKMIFELQPDIEWDKGRALLWLLNTLDLDTPDVLPVYIGDDTTDEDAFRVLEHKGIGILVTDNPGETYANYVLKDPDEVEEFLNSMITICRRIREYE